MVHAELVVAPEYMPASHKVHVEAPSIPAYLPATHGSQCSAPSAYFPAVQAVQVGDPVEETLPGEQSKQGVLLSFFAEDLPAGQSAQV